MGPRCDNVAPCFFNFQVYLFKEIDMKLNNKLGKDKKLPLVYTDRAWDSIDVDRFFWNMLFVIVILFFVGLVLVFATGCSYQGGFSTARHHRPINVILDHVLPYRHQQDQFGE